MTSKNAKKADDYVCQCFSRAGITLQTAEVCGDTTEFQLKHVGHTCFALAHILKSMFKLKKRLKKDGYTDLQLSQIISEVDKMETTLGAYADLFSTEAHDGH